MHAAPANLIDGVDGLDLPPAQRVQLDLGGILQRPFIYAGASKLRQRLVRCLLFVERLLQQRNRVIQAEQPCPGYQCPITGDLIMLDGLGSGNKPGVEGRRRLELLQYLPALLNDAVDRGTGLALRALAENLEHLLQPLNLTLSLVAVLLERGGQLLRFGTPGHFLEGT